MAWLKQGQAPTGLPPFAPRPPPVAPPLCGSGRAGSLSSDGAPPSHYSTDTQPSMLEEEEELSRELTMELLEDFALEEQSRRGSSHPSRKPSEGLLPAGEGAADADAAAAGEQQAGEWEARSDDTPAPSPEPSLYDQLGGGVAVKAVVDRFYCRVLGDPQLGHFFEGVDMTKHARKFLLFVTYVLGGPDEYLQLRPEPWPALYTVHEELIRRHGLCERHFDLVKEHFGEALQGVGAPPKLIDLALGVVESTRRIMFPPGVPQPGAQQAQQAQPQQAQPQQSQQAQQQQAPAGSEAANQVAARAGGCPAEFHT